MTQSAKRLIFTVYPPVLLAVVGAAFFGPWSAALPDPLATHWGLSWTPDGFTALRTFRVGIMVALTGFAVLQALALGLGALRGSGVGRALLHVSAGLFVALASAALDIFAVNHGVENAVDAELGWIHVLAMVLPMLVTQMGLFRVLAEPSKPGAADSGASVGLGEGEQAVWIGDLQSWPLKAVALVLPVVMAGIGTFTDNLILWAAAIFVGLVTWACSAVHVTVRAQGLTVAYGPLRWPRTHIPLARIVAVREEYIEPMVWGGWGYRGSLWLTGKAAVVLRRGPGIVLELENGKQFCVTVDRAGEAAGLLSDFVRRRAC